MLSIKRTDNEWLDAVNWFDQRYNSINNKIFQIAHDADDGTYLRFDLTAIEFQLVSDRWRKCLGDTR